MIEELREAKSPRQSKPKVVQSETQKLLIDRGRWLTTREAWDLYGEGISQNTFRKLTPEDLLRRFNLESDLSRRVHGKTDSRWLRKRETD